MSPVSAQSRVQFPSPYQAAPPLVPVNPNLGAGGFSSPGTFQQPGFQPPGAVLGGTIQPFDPYALPGNLGTATGGFPQAGQGLPSFSTPPPSVWPGQPPPSLSVGPMPNLSPNGAYLSPLPGSPYGEPTAPLNRVTDPYFQGSPYAGTQQYAEQAVRGPPYQRLFQDTGPTVTYIYGNDKDDLALTEIEASTTAVCANFLGLTNGLRVTPGFSILWTAGPSAPETSDVPARLYSGYLDFGLEPEFTPRFGAELSARFGIYSDFQSFNNEALRLLATGVGTYQMSPQAELKLGVIYIDRVKYKLFPAIGVLWTPNPQTRWDIFFPSPKLSNYWTTSGNQQYWWYVGGEYGGGSWSIEREERPLQGAKERIDINDIRIYVGIEWWNLNRFYGFGEIGYVFNREVVYYRVPRDTLNIDDSFMLRAGIYW